MDEDAVPATGESGNLPIAWQPVPTVVVDAAIGNVTVGGVYRVTLAELALNPEAGAIHPLAKPVVTLSLTPVAAAYLIEYLTKMTLPAGSGQQSDAE